MPGRFVYRRCYACRSVYQDPRVVSEDLPLCYPEQYYTHETPLDPLPAPASRLRQWLRREVIGWLEDDPIPRVLEMILAMRLRPPSLGATPRALDVGCGRGEVLRLLARKGFEAHGIEWDARAAEIARRETGRPVDVGDFRTGLLPKAAFDLVLLHHVLEHLDAPRSALARAAELISPAGVVLLVWPNPRSLGARLFGANWFHWDPPRHLVLPTASALAQAAREVGLRVLPAEPPVGSIARLAQLDSRNSRAYRRGQHPAETPPSRVDQLFAAVERVLVGRGLGKEALLLLRKG
ncbi:MAG: class I SAM-dependent methyltransferase [Candidatus Rokuibacteriota bacterium]